MWGQASKSISAGNISRIIPTRVGTRTSPFHIIGMYKDHPHACGDKTATLSKGGKIQGSSPRVWGQAQHAIGKPRLERIIPTRVGTRGFLKNGKFFKKDHPHACGDKISKILGVRK